MAMAESIRGNGFADNFCDNFMKSKFYEVYKKHTDELFIGIRDGYLNIYYNCASIAKIRTKRGTIGKAAIDKYYTNNKLSSLTADEFEERYEEIKKNSDAKNDLEKKSQERLVLDNNNNPHSDWYCLDVEYMKSIEGKLKNWRFDIIAISKKAPHRVALIELKYGSGAIGGESGIQKHLKDYGTFIDKNCYEQYHLKQEIVNIIRKQKILVKDFPKELDTIEEQNITNKPEVYIITLNNNKIEDGSSPRKTMWRYLFIDERLEKEETKTSIIKEYSKEDLKKDLKKLKPTFLFSSAELTESGRLTRKIDDILNEKCYDKVGFDDDFSDL